jgi:P4 family phage/plasmid primase-like protien
MENTVISLSLPTHYNNLFEFLSKHKAKDDKTGAVVTHTRIPDESLKIYAGSYIIPREELQIFYDLYYKHIFIDKKFEYLTEKQQTTGKGPILIDLDFRFSYDVDSRQHSKEHITDLLTQVYLEELKEFFIFTEDTPFQIYVMEKPDVIRLEDKKLTKDGIHIIIGIQMDHIMQQILRKKVIPKITELWEGFPLTNTYDSVLDEGISKGPTNWQMYGSRKPGNLAYELTHVYNVSMDMSDGEFMFNEVKLNQFDLATNFTKLSAQYEDHPRFEINPKIKEEYQRMIEKKISKPSMKKPLSKTKVMLLEEEDDEVAFVDINDIVNAEMLDKAITYMFSTFTTEEYILKEIHEYTQILPEKYYESGSHEKNRSVAFALKNTDERLFLSWIKLRSKAIDFNYSDITELYNKWTKYFNRNENNSGLTYKSILYWARQDAYTEYIKVKGETINHFIDATILEPRDWDLAMILHHMFKDKYVCTSIKSGIWYVFNNHCWEEDKGDRLRYAISKEMFALYKEKRDKIVANSYTFAAGSVEKQKAIDDCSAINKIMDKLKKTSDKNNIFREAHEIFYDPKFDEKMDTNEYLMCFSNGVVDFQNKIFRDGHPQDYITKTTKIPYIPFETLDHENEIVQNILTFMEQLFPNVSLNKYMWDHLSSVLIGKNMNQTFNIYVGSGSNGKSILMDLMSQTLGLYKGTVPITLVTTQRNSIGGTSSEVIQLKGLRYAVMQEPSKNAVINEGVMKELTGGDPIQARGLYKETETFNPQFSLAVCTNTLFDITSNDDGTWRRIRICNYMSKFVDELPTEEEIDLDSDVKYFLKDKTLKEKLPKWAPIFASMLVKRVFENEGKVVDCDIVMMASNKYRNGQDYISGFVNEKIQREHGKKLNKSGISEEFKLWYSSRNMGNNRTNIAPRPAEIHDYLDKKFGVNKKGTWDGITWIRDTPIDDIVDLAAYA